MKPLIKEINEATLLEEIRRQKENAGRQEMGKFYSSEIDEEADFTANKTTYHKYKRMSESKYNPPPSSVKLLGAIADLIKRAEKIEYSFATIPKAVLKLEGGELYFDSLLNLDTDGSVYYAQDAQGQQQTSIENADGSPVDSDAVPYFVLPEKNFYQRFGIRLGDVAAVIYRDKIEFAVFADEYGHQYLEEQLGEGSIALHRALGHETIIKGRLVDEAIDEGVIKIVFPASGIEGVAQTPEKIRAVGKRLFLALGGKLLENFNSTGKQL